MQVAILVNVQSQFLLYVCTSICTKQPFIFYSCHVDHKIQINFLGTFLAYQVKHISFTPNPFFLNLSIYSHVLQYELKITILVERISRSIVPLQLFFLLVIMLLR